MVPDRSQDFLAERVYAYCAMTVSPRKVANHLVLPACQCTFLPHRKSLFRYSRESGTCPAQRAFVQIGSSVFSKKNYAQLIAILVPLTKIPIAVICVERTQMHLQDSCETINVTTDRRMSSKHLAEDTQHNPCGRHGTLLLAPIRAGAHFRYLHSLIAHSAKSRSRTDTCIST